MGDRPSHRNPYDRQPDRQPPRLTAQAKHVTSSWGVLTVVTLAALLVAWAFRRGLPETVTRRLPAAAQVGRTTWATLVGESPASTAVLRPGLVLDRTPCPAVSLSAASADQQPHGGAIHPSTGGEFELSGTDGSGSSLRDEVMGSLYSAGLNLSRLEDRLSDPQDQRTLDAALQHLDDVVRDVQLLLLNTGDRPT